MRTVIQASGIAQPQGIRGCKNAEIGMGMDDLVLIGHGKSALLLQDLLDHKHDIWTPRIVLIKDQRNRALQGPGNDSLLKGRDLSAFFDLDGILANQVQSGNMTI